MTTSVTSKMTKDDMVNVLIILMDIPKTAEGGFRSSMSKVSTTALNMMYNAWIQANNKCELAKREAQYAKEHQAVAERRAASFEREVKKLRVKLKEAK